MGPSAKARGIVYMVAAVALLAALDAVARHLTQSYPVPQILWVRYLFFLLFAWALVRRTGVKAALRSRRPLFQTVRALLLVLEIGVFVLAFRYLRLADVHAIASATPLVVTAVAWPMLGEHVGARRWAAVTIGFAAVLVILRPGFRALDWTAFIPVVGTLLWALYQIMLRVVARSDSVETTLAYTAVTGAAALSLVGPFVWTPPDTEGWLLLGLAAVLGAAAHFALIKSLAAAPVVVLQPYSYSLIVWAVLFGWLVFGEFPDAWTLGGAAVIVAVGLYSLRREQLEDAAGDGARG